MKTKIRSRVQVVEDDNDKVIEKMMSFKWMS
jgi:hypothetical protein